MSRGGVLRKSTQEENIWHNKKTKIKNHSKETGQIKVGKEFNM